MDFILPDQLHKYEDLIERINQEHKKCEELKQTLSNENDKVIMYNLSASRINHKISHVAVKVFSNIFDLFALYEDEVKIDMKQFLKYTSHKFYLIEVYLTDALLQKISAMKCMINICISYEGTNINKSMKITSNSPSPLLEIIPVDETVVNCTLDTMMLTDQSMMIKLDSVLIDISYHFQAYDKKRKPNLRVTSILQVAKRYNEELGLKELNEKLILDYEIKCQIGTREFIGILLKNSYHYLGSDLFTELISSDKNEIMIQISLGFSKCEIAYNRNNKFRLRATLANLLLLKKYFFTKIHQLNDNVEKMSTIQELKDSIPIRIEDATQYYNNLRKCWSYVLEH